MSVKGRDRSEAIRQLLEREGFFCGDITTFITAGIVKFNVQYKITFDQVLLISSVLGTHNITLFPKEGRLTAWFRVECADVDFSRFDPITSSE